MICLSETYLGSNILPDDSNMEIPGYYLVHSDHLSNKKDGGVCIYYKSHLPLIIIDINYLNECMRFELMVGDRLCNNTMFFNSSTVETGISDHYSLICRMLHSTFCKDPAKNLYITGLITTIIKNSSKMF